MCELQTKGRDYCAPSPQAQVFSALGGGTGLKASDIFVMPLCFECHTKAHNGDRDVLDWQAQFIFKTLDKATKHGVISISYTPYETLIL